MTTRRVEWDVWQLAEPDDLKGHVRYDIKGRRLHIGPLTLRMPSDEIWMMEDARFILAAELLGVDERALRDFVADEFGRRLQEHELRYGED